MTKLPTLWMNMRYMAFSVHHFSLKHPAAFIVSAGDFNIHAISEKQFGFN
jgi:hypothetical protein